jgi:hypothetical protein
LAAGGRGSGRHAGQPCADLGEHVSNLTLAGAPGRQPRAAAAELDRYGRHLAATAAQRHRQSARAAMIGTLAIGTLAIGTLAVGVA